MERLTPSVALDPDKDKTNPNLADTSTSGLLSDKVLPIKDRVFIGWMGFIGTELLGLLNWKENKTSIRSRRHDESFENLVNRCNGFSWGRHETSGPFLSHYYDNLSEIHEIQ